MEIHQQPRYTKPDSQKITEEMLTDIDKETVDFSNNFDDTLEEPAVLPTKFPNLLINGSSGIAVGMATNILPHNLSEVCDGIVAYINNRDHYPGTDGLYKGPDFPTGGQIYGVEGISEGFETGRGRIVVRGTADIETMKKWPGTDHRYRHTLSGSTRPCSSPRQQNWSMKRIEGISDIRDESNREGMRIVYELKRDAVASVVLNQLFKIYTAPNQLRRQ